MNKLQVNTKVLAKLSNYDKSFVDAYLFAKLLTQFVKHPILYHFNANREAYRLKLGMGKYKYRRLLKSAIEQGFAVYHGDNLHIISHTKERRLFSVKSNHQTEIKPSELHQFARAQILIRNIKSQKRAIANKKGGSTGFAPNTNDVLNQSPVMSCRKAGALLNVSHTHAKYLLTRLSNFGLTVKQNAVQISMEQYQQLKTTGSYNIRYNDGKHLFVGASLIDYKKPPAYKVSSGSYCSNDI